MLSLDRDFGNVDFWAEDYKYLNSEDELVSPRSVSKKRRFANRHSSGNVASKRKRVSAKSSSMGNDDENNETANVSQLIDNTKTDLMDMEDLVTGGQAGDKGQDNRRLSNGHSSGTRSRRASDCRSKPGSKNMAGRSSARGDDSPAAETSRGARDANGSP